MRIENIEFDPETGRATLAGTGEPLKFPECGVLESDPVSLGALVSAEPVEYLVSPELFGPDPAAASEREAERHAEEFNRRLRALPAPGPREETGT